MNAKQTLCLALIAAAPLAMAARRVEPITTGYPIEISKKQLNGLDIKIVTSSGPAAVVLLENRSNKPARCSVDFVNGPQTPITHSANIAPGKSYTFSHPADREVTIYRVGITCVEHKPGAE